MMSSGPVTKLQEIVAIPTVSSPDPRLTPTAEFDRLLAAMERLWPRVHALEPPEGSPEDDALGRRITAGAQP
jgi:hypothetical protein